MWADECESLKTSPQAGFQGFMTWLIYHRGITAKKAMPDQAV
jgi:hypothetical protein